MINAPLAIGNPLERWTIVQRYIQSHNDSKR